MSAADSQDGPGAGDAAQKLVKGARYFAADTRARGELLAGQAAEAARNASSAGREAAAHAGSAAAQAGSTAQRELERLRATSGSAAAALRNWRAQALQGQVSAEGFAAAVGARCAAARREVEGRAGTLGAAATGQAQAAATRARHECARLARKIVEASEEADREASATLEQAMGPSEEGAAQRGIGGAARWLLAGVSSGLLVSSGVLAQGLGRLQGLHTELGAQVAPEAVEEAPQQDLSFRRHAFAMALGVFLGAVATVAALRAQQAAPEEDDGAARGSERADLWSLWRAGGASPQRPADPPLFRGPERRSASRSASRPPRAPQLPEGNSQEILAKDDMDDCISIRRTQIYRENGNVHVSDTQYVDGDAGAAAEVPPPQRGYEEATIWQGPPPTHTYEEGLRA